MCVKVTPTLEISLSALGYFRHFAAEWSSKQGQRFKMGSPEAKIAILVFQVPRPHESKFLKLTIFPTLRRRLCAFSTPRFCCTSKIEKVSTCIPFSVTFRPPCTQTLNPRTRSLQRRRSLPASRRRLQPQACCMLIGPRLPGQEPKC